MKYFLIVSAILIALFSALSFIQSKNSSKSITQLDINSCKNTYEKQQLIIIKNSQDQKRILSKIELESLAFLKSCIINDSKKFDSEKDFENYMITHIAFLMKKWNKHGVLLASLIATNNYLVYKRCYIMKIDPFSNKHQKL